MKSLFLSLLALLVAGTAQAAMSANEIYLLDKKMGPVAYQVKLGTLLHSIEQVTNGTLADGKIFIGDALGAAQEVTPSGDVTITNAGVTAIGAGKVTKTMLATAVLPSHVVKFAGSTASENDADATVTKAVAGLLATDIVSCTIRGQANSVAIAKCVPTADTLTVTLTGNGGAGTVVDYVAYRAVP